jgi:hypothetical protein
MPWGTVRRAESLSRSLRPSFGCLKVKSMGALSEFLKRNQISKSSPLPLVHTTESYHLKKIVSSGAIKASRCNVFRGETLSYFFVGRAAYKRDLHQEAEYWELPTCLVFSFFADGIKRIYPLNVRSIWHIAAD